ncbi:hypothetical protein V8G54_012914 [Vigna mungo]|uniref:Uncharacterized protein n=1 Tax=Vigna mungo TaxID=3915 RepID=A0AAQ3S3S9_VIGMU
MPNPIFAYSSSSYPKFPLSKKFQQVVNRFLTAFNPLASVHLKPPIKSECCWGRLAFEKKTLAWRGRRAALVAPVRERFRREQRQPTLSTMTGPVDDGCRRRRLGSGGDDSGNKPHHRCNLNSWFERRREWLGCAVEGECVFLSCEGERAKWWWSAVKGGGFFGANTGNTVGNDAVVVRVVAEATTSMRWRPVSLVAPLIGYVRAQNPEQ